MKHRHDRQNDVARGETLQIRLKSHQRVQEIGSMGVQDPLGLTGRPRREAKARGRVFRKLAPPRRRRMSRDERIIIVPDGILVQFVPDRTRAVDHDDVANGRAARQDLSEPSGE